MANAYRCRDCGKVLDVEYCEDCNARHVEALGDIHLGALGIDAYVGILPAGDDFHLIIKKPSGQESIKLTKWDWLR